MQKIIIQNPEEMKIIGKFLAKNHPILLLEGDLGAGKTTLSKGYAEALGIDENKIQSPTYTYINTYEDKLLHVDMRRLESYQDLIKKGIKDEIEQAEKILIEWPKFVDQLDFITSPLFVHIKKISPTSREISFSPKLSTNEFNILGEQIQTAPYDM